MDSRKTLSRVETIARFDRIGWTGTVLIFAAMVLLATGWWPGAAWFLRFLGDATWAFAGWYLGSRAVYLTEGAFAALDLVVLAAILISPIGPLD